jgi:hypothetical protein
LIVPMASTNLDMGSGMICVWTFRRVLSANIEKALTLVRMDVVSHVLRELTNI